MAPTFHVTLVSAEQVAEWPAVAKAGNAQLWACIPPSGCMLMEDGKPDFPDRALRTAGIQDQQRPGAC